MNSFTFIFAVKLFTFTLIFAVKLFSFTLIFAVKLFSFTLIFAVKLFSFTLIFAVKLFTFIGGFFMIYGVFGLPRSGKTTFLCKIAKKYIKRGKKVFTNFPCKGCYKLDFQTLGKFNYCDCILLIDEISLICDSRDWKNFNSDLRYFFTNHGHYNIDIYYCSQWFTDCDIKIRRMTEQLYYIERKFCGLSMRFDVIRDVFTTENGEIADSYKFKHGRLFFRPPYYKMFNSFSRKELPDFEPELWNEV